MTFAKKSSLRFGTKTLKLEFRAYKLTQKYISTDFAANIISELSKHKISFILVISFQTTLWFIKILPQNKKH